MHANDVDAELQQLAGRLVCEAYFEDSEFRNKLAPILSTLHQAFEEDVPRWFAVSSFEHYVVSAYHAARAIEHLKALQQISPNKQSIQVWIDSLSAGDSNPGSGQPQ